MKQCGICKAVKPLSDFHRQISRLDGHCDWCKPCKSVKKAAEYQRNRERTLERVAAYRAANPGKVSAAKKRCYEAKKEQYSSAHKNYYEKNKEAILASCKFYREANRDKTIARGRAYRSANRLRLNARQSEYQRDNWDRIKGYQAAYSAERYKTDPLYALSRLVRRRVSIALKEHGYAKSNRTAVMLGCDYEHLLAHLESKFYGGMSWENRGEWHIDHKIPLASASTETELLALCHYTNLQPLWSGENLSKGARMPAQGA